jgi:predicted nucleotidyltransferase
MVHPQNRSRSERKERIDISYDYAVCAWARHFNVSQKHVKEAVAAVGDDAERVREHLARQRSSERPSAR